MYLCSLFSICLCILYKKKICSGGKVIFLKYCDLGYRFKNNKQKSSSRMFHIINWHSSYIFLPVSKSVSNMTFLPLNDDQLIIKSCYFSRETGLYIISAVIKTVLPVRKGSL